MTDLKRCPFCGMKIEDYELTVSCGKAHRLEIRCCVNFDICEDNEKDAVEIWNTRAFDVRC